MGAFFLGGSLVTHAQEREDGREENWRETSDEERRERWERYRGMSREERRALWRERQAEEAEAEPATEEARTGLEFRSILQLDGETQFSVRDNDADRTVWLSVGEVRGGIRAVSFDEDSETLTLERDGETMELGLMQSRVADVGGEDAEREDRRERWRQRRERFQEFRERWRSAAEESPKLQEIESHFREAGREMWQLRRAMRDTERGSDERDLLRDEFRDIREEMRLLSEYATEEIRQNPAFEEQDVDLARHLSRMLAFQRRGGRR